MAKGADTDGDAAMAAAAEGDQKKRSTRNNSVLTEHVWEAASSQGDVKAVTNWLRSGGLVDARESGEETHHTMLMGACINGHKEVVELLLKKGADVNIQGVFNRTALHWAALNGQIDITKMLLAAGADFDLVDGSGYTALDMARFKDHRGVWLHIQVHMSNLGVKEGPGLTVEAYRNASDVDTTTDEEADDEEEAGGKAAKGGKGKKGAKGKKESAGITKGKKGAKAKETAEAKAKADAMKVCANPDSQPSHSPSP